MADVRHAPAAEREDVARLGAGGERQRLRAVERRDLDRGAQGRLAEADRHLADQVAAFALEERMLGHADGAVAVAAGPAVGARLALAGQPDLVARVDAGGDIDLAGDPPTGRSRWPRQRGHASRMTWPAAAAGRAGRLQREEAAALHHAAAAAAIGAGFRAGAGLGPAAAARLARLVPVELDDLGDPVGRLEQVERHRALDVLALVRPPPPAAAEQVAEQALAEDVAEGLEDVAHVAELRGLAAPRPAKP